MKRTLTAGMGIVLIAVLLATALPFVPRSSHAQEMAPANGSDGAAPEGAAPDTITTGNPHPGIYFIDGGAVELDPAVFPVDGVVRFYNWETLNPRSGSYSWGELDATIARRKAQGLETGIMLDTYGGVGSGDIRKVPDFVILQPNSVVPATNASDSSPNYASYWRRGSYNADFNWSNITYGWELEGAASITTAPVGSTGNAGRLGGLDNATGRLTHSPERIPAMPASVGGITAYIDVSVYIETTDVNPNDHLYLELWETKNNVQIGSVRLDINNLSHPPDTWKTYTLDVSSVAHGTSPRVTFRVVNDGANPTTFWVDNIGLYVRHLIPNYESAA